MNPSPDSVREFAESLGFTETLPDGNFERRCGPQLKDFLTKEMAASLLCYSKGETRTNSEGAILNECGLPAKKGDIILRATNGYVFKRVEE